MLDLHGYKRHLGIRGTEDDVRRNNSLQAAILVAKNYTGSSFHLAGTTQTQDSDFPKNSGYILVDYPDIEEVTSVTFKKMDFDSANDIWTDRVLTADEDYFVDTSLGMVEFDVSNYPKQKRGVSIEYKISSEIPFDYVLAVYELSTYYFNREFNMKKQLAGQELEYNDTSILPTNVKTILDLHRCL